MSRLAINGGTPVRTKLFPSQNTMAVNEMQAVTRVMNNGRLSGYRGNWGNEFLGGPEIRALSDEWNAKFGGKYAIPVNSCTSGLHVACGAIGLKPGDEVIVTPYSMTCSATAPMLYGATPVFADIDPETYNLDPESVRSKITEKTKAIIVVDLFGHPFDMEEILDIAVEHDLFVIEDAAQALGATYPYMNYTSEIKAVKTGLLCHIGVFSFNYGKHINCGEGGMIVTKNDDLALKCRLLMNHSEAVINGMENSRRVPLASLRHTPGFNMRMTELQACIIREQIKKFDTLQEQRMQNVNYLIDNLSEIPAIKPPMVKPGYSHTFYCLSFQWNQEEAGGLHRDKFIEAVKAELTPRQDRDGEGIPIGCGYIKPLYTMPIFGQEHGLCPVCEDLWANKLFLTLYHAPMSTIADCADVINAFFKVWVYRGEIK